MSSNEEIKFTPEGGDDETSLDEIFSQIFAGVEEEGDLDGALKTRSKKKSDEMPLKDRLAFIAGCLNYEQEYAKNPENFCVQKTPQGVYILFTLMNFVKKDLDLYRKAFPWLLYSQAATFVALIAIVTYLIFSS